MCKTIRIRNLMVASLLAIPAAGCADYNWQWSFQSVDQLKSTEQRAAQEHKMVFIFYKSYLDSDSNRMHGDVLADNTVGSQFNDTVNIAIDKSAGPAYEQYLTKYGVTAPPACILVAPDGRYKVYRGYIAKDRFIDMVKGTKAEFAEPSRRPPPSKVAP